MVFKPVFRILYQALVTTDTLKREAQIYSEALGPLYQKARSHIAENSLHVTYRNLAPEQTLYNLLTQLCVAEQEVKSYLTL